jgi:ATP-dependent DNA ligase
MKVGKAEFFPAKSFNGEKLKNEIDEFRTLVATRYQALLPSELSKHLTGSEFFVSKKIDGELWYLFINDSETKLIAPNGRFITGDLPIINQAKTLGKNIFLVGELHAARPNKRERVGDVSQILAQGEKAEVDVLSFAVFDFVSSDEKNWKELGYKDRRNLLNELIKDQSNLFLASEKILKSIEEVTSFYQEIEKIKAEGLIVRSDDARTFKVKPGIDLDVVIIGFTERQNEDGSKEIRSLLTALMKEDKTLIPIGATANISESVSRKELYEKLSKNVVKSQYRQSATSGQMYQFCKPETIIQIKAVDAQALDSKGRAIKQVALDFDPNNGYLVKGQVNAVSLTNIFLVRLREDKPVDATSVRFDQITDYLPVQAEVTSIDVKPTIKVRKVWVKKSADKTDVRKLVMWKTNKEEIDPSFPAFVVHWTDYSSTRKSPLNREVRPVMNEEEANKICENLIAENIKKGWDEV